MRSAWLATAAFALAAGITAPAIAETWVTYHEERVDNLHNLPTRYEIDAASIVKHNGTIYANERFCQSKKFLADTYPCVHVYTGVSNPPRIRQISANCSENTFKIHLASYTLQPDGKWKDFFTEVMLGPQQSSEFHKKVNVRIDKAFKFLCG